MNLLQSILIYFVSPVLSFLVILIFVQVILSWLVSFGVVNLRNPIMRQIYYTVEALTKPIMSPIQRIIPPMGGLDFSPIVALLLIQWLNGYVVPSMVNAVG